MSKKTCCTLLAKLKFSSAQTVFIAGEVVWQHDGGTRITAPPPPHTHIHTLQHRTDIKREQRAKPVRRNLAVVPPLTPTARTHDPPDIYPANCPTSTSKPGKNRSAPGGTSTIPQRCTPQDLAPATKQRNAWVQAHFTQTDVKPTHEQETNDT